MTDWWTRKNERVNELPSQARRLSVRSGFVPLTIVTASTIPGLKLEVGLRGVPHPLSMALPSRELPVPCTHGTVLPRLPRCSENRFSELHLNNMA